MPCSVSDFPGQDAEYGGNNVFSFTKLDANGNDLPATATDHACVRDNNTGLIWQVNGQSADFDALNEARLCGRTDWHIPNSSELFSLVDLSYYQFGERIPLINMDYFPDATASGYRTTEKFHSYNLIVSFGYGGVYGDGDKKDVEAIPVRLVSGSMTPVSLLSDAETVTDSTTELMWAKCPLGQTGVGCEGYSTEMTWQEALKIAADSDLAGYTDWRLPNTKELQFLVHSQLQYQEDGNIIPDETYFPNPQSANPQGVKYWTSSWAHHKSDTPNPAWLVHEQNIVWDQYGDLGVVRLVRGGAKAEQRNAMWRVVEIYIATLGYTPDNEGLRYWVDNIQQGGWTPAQVAQSFFDQPLVEAMYPIDQGYGSFINALYRNIFGRAADEEGYDYWLGELESGNVQRNQMIIALIEGGWANPDAVADMARFGNRVQVGLAFAAEQVEREIRYSSLSADDQAKLRQIGADLIDGVTGDTETRDAAIDQIPELLSAF